MNINVVKILVNKKLLTKEQYNEALKKAQFAKRNLDDVLISLGYVKERALFEAKAESVGLEYIDLTTKQIPKTVLEIIPQQLAENYQVICFNKSTNTISVAILDAGDVRAREAATFLARSKGLKIKYYLSSESGIREALKLYGALDQEIGEALEAADEKYRIPTGKDGEENIIESGEILKNAPVAKIASSILRHGVEGKASDIHIEPLAKESRVRYRIDGQLSTSILLPIYIHDSLISRLKIMANLKIDETRIPQDGRIRIHMEGKDVDFRVSTIPLTGHEKIVLRILDTSKGAPPIEKLGYLGRNLDVIKKETKKPNGMFLMTGPTGSGKSMTLFSILTSVNKIEINISTLEDPVEYHVEGVNQSQMRPNVGFTFASGLRALLRQDPDVIMVGEIRDLETAELGIHAAMTGHFVLSTLHTNDAIGSIPRFTDMHVEPFLLAATLNCVVAQRLVRTICQDCKIETKLEKTVTDKVLPVVQGMKEHLVKPYAIDTSHPIFYKGSGCEKCGDSGYSGRTAIAEVLINTTNMKKIITSGLEAEAVQKELEAQDFITLKQDGFLKAMQGKTTVEEVLATTKEE